MRTSTRLFIGLLATAIAVPALAADMPTIEEGFLTDYSKLQPVSGNAQEFRYVAPDGFKRLAAYNGVVVDEPEVHVSPDSPYKGAKPGDLSAVASNMRIAISDALKAGNYSVPDQPGAGLIYLRLAITDLDMKKKKRGILAYTPIGAVVKVGADAVKDMMEKVDITGMALQAELTDSVSGEVLAALVYVRPESKDRMEFDELDSMMKGYGARIRCNLDNARVPANQQIDCLDAKALAARPPVNKPQ